MWTVDGTAAAVITGLLGAFAYMVGFVRGHGAGVKETERRWSEAVGRADDRRQHPTDVPIKPPRRSQVNGY
jgi:hypothetical protein